MTKSLIKRLKSKAQICETQYMKNGMGLTPVLKFYEDLIATYPFSDYIVCDDSTASMIGNFKGFTPRLETVSSYIKKTGNLDHKIDVYKSVVSLDYFIILGEDFSKEEPFAYITLKTKI